MEIELKYLITESSNIDGLESFFADNDAHEIDMHATYYKDAPHVTEKKLDKTTFRIRQENNKKVITMKWGGKSTNGLHERHEVNIPFDEYISGNIPFEVKEIAPKLENIAAVLEMSFIRREFELKTEDFTAIMSIDKGKITKNDKELPIFEVEIEHFSGDIKKMTEFGEEFAKKYALLPGNASKYARGMVL